MKPTILHAACAALLCGTSTAQIPGSEFEATANLADWRIPIHTAEADPEGGLYGVWAAGPDYKVSFHDGFAFYPVLGEAYPENLPLVWHTASISAGGSPVLTDRDLISCQYSDWRYEVRYPGVIEAYDVLREGVEQTFTLTQPPPLGGDLVIRGRIATPLLAAPLAAQHAEVVFTDDAGNALVSYGKALAFDALGRVHEVRTSYSGEELSLHVDGEWLSEASYPVIVDPLTSNTTISTWGLSTYGTPADTDIAREDESNHLMVIYTRSSSASDRDAFARRCDDSFGSAILAFTDVSASWSTSHPRVAFVGGADRWVMVFQRTFTAGNCRVRAYLHDKGNTILNSGTVLLHGSGTSSQHNPDVGGVANFTNGSKALVVYQQDGGSTCGNGDYSDVVGVLLDASTPAFETPFGLAAVPAGLSYDRDHPSVIQATDGGSTSWIVAWQEYNHGIANDDWDAVIARIEHDGSKAGQSSIGNGAAARHKVRPVVEGRGGRYIASFPTIANSGKTSFIWGTALEVQRFDWPETANAPTHRGPVRRIASSSGGFLFNGNGIGYDSTSQSHWAIPWSRNSLMGGNSQVFVARVGYTGGIVEQRTVYNSRAADGWSPSATFDDDHNEFQIAFATNENAPAGQPVYGVHLQYYPEALNRTYGTGCQGAIAASSAPCAGTEFFTIGLSSGVPNAPSALLLGLAPGSVPLGNGCFLNLDPSLTIIFLYQATTSSSGAARCTVPLPDVPYVYGDVYLQWIQFTPAATFATTRGFHAHIR